MTDMTLVTHHRALGEPACDGGWTIEREVMNQPCGIARRVIAMQFPCAGDNFQ
jgi:hypothetical protein